MMTPIELFSPEEMVEIHAEAAKAAKNDRLNTYSQEVLFNVEETQEEINCGHEYMLLKLEAENALLKAKIELILDFLNLKVIE